MNEADRAFWSAVVQIVPVLLLTLVVEARYMRLGRKRARKFWKQLASHRPADARSFKGAAQAAVWLALRMYGFVIRTVLAPITMLVVVAVLTTTEVVSLFVLASDNAASLE